MLDIRELGNRDIGVLEMAVARPADGLACGSHIFDWLYCKNENSCNRWACVPCSAHGLIFITVLKQLEIQTPRILLHTDPLFSNPIDPDDPML